MLVTHSAPDVREALVDVCNESTTTPPGKTDVPFQRTQWVFGERLFQLSDTQCEHIAAADGLVGLCGVAVAGMVRGYRPSNDRLTTICDEVSRLTDTLFVFDFSGVDANQWASSNVEKRDQFVVDSIKHFVHEVATERSRNAVLIGLPRWLLKSSTIRALVSDAALKRRDSIQLSCFPLPIRAEQLNSNHIRQCRPPNGYELFSMRIARPCLPKLSTSSVWNLSMRGRPTNPRSRRALYCGWRPSWPRRVFSKLPFAWSCGRSAISQ